MKNEAVSLSVSIVLYHSPIEMLGATLSSLYGACRCALEQGQLEDVVVVVIDNSQSRNYSGSVQGLLAELNTDPFFTTRYTAAPKNDGFGAGHNRVLPLLESDVHLVLNPDAELDEHALSAGLGALRTDSSLALVSPKVLSSSGEQEFLCKSYPSVLVLLLRAFAPTLVRNWFRQNLDDYEVRDITSGNQAADVLLASGCFMLLRSAALVEVKGFNEKYFLYFEDFDLSLRLRDQGRLQFLPAMQITHHGGYAAGKGGGHIWLFIKSGFRFFNDHGWKWI